MKKTDFAMPEFGSFNIDEMKTNCGQLFLRNSNTLMEKNLLFYNILEKLKFENQSENYSLATSIRIRYIRQYYKCFILIR